MLIYGAIDKSYPIFELHAKLNDRFISRLRLYEAPFDTCLLAFGFGEFIHLYFITLSSHKVAGSAGLLS